MNRVAFVVAQLLIMGSATAAPVTFKCTTADGTPAADLVVDVEKRTMVWSIAKYTIHAIDDRYISAYQNSQSGAGGEVWVLDRTTGKYLRAGVSIGWEGPEAAKAAMQRNDPGKISSHTYSGQCSRPLL